MYSACIAPPSFPKTFVTDGKATPNKVTGEQQEGIADEDIFLVSAWPRWVVQCDMPHIAITRHSLHSHLCSKPLQTISR